MPDSNDAVRDLLLATRRIAVVGASDRPDRPSHGVFRFLLDRGYDAVPVNPTLAGTSRRLFEPDGRPAELTLGSVEQIGETVLTTHRRQR